MYRLNSKSAYYNYVIIYIYLIYNNNNNNNNNMADRIAQSV